MLCIKSRDLPLKWNRINLETFFDRQIDNVSELKKIYTSLMASLQSIVALAQKQSSLDNVWGLISIQTPDLGILSKLPTISALKLSVWNLLRNRELPTLGDLYYTYR